MAAEVVDGEVLAVQAHVGEEVELVAVVVEDEELLLVPRLGPARQLLQTPLLLLVPAQDHVGLGLDTHELQYVLVKQVYNKYVVKHKSANLFKTYAEGKLEAALNISYLILITSSQRVT